MQLTLYRRTFPAAGAPVALSFAPDHARQRHTFTAGGRVYEADRDEVRVVAPAGAKADWASGRLSWAGDRGPVRSTAAEVYELARAGMSGFRLAE